MVEPLQEDLLLISRIKGLRSKNAHVQAQTSKMREILADWQEHQERERKNKLNRRRRIVKVLEKFSSSLKMAFASWRSFIKQRERQLQQQELQAALQDRWKSMRLRLLVIYLWRCSVLQERLALFNRQKDQAQVQLSTMRLRLLKERRSHRLADTRATLAGLQVLGAHLPFGVTPGATTSELAALSFCAWHLRTAMMSGRDPWAKGGKGTRLKPGTVRGKSQIERTGIKALHLNCRIARRLALQCLLGWRESSGELASQRARSSRLKEWPAKRTKAVGADAKELLRAQERSHLLQVFLNWRCVAVTLLCERRVRQEAKAAASECALLQVQVDHWRDKCKEDGSAPPGNVTFSVAKVFTAWYLVLRNERHEESVAPADREKQLKCTDKETALLRLVFLALQVNAQAGRAEREGFVRRNTGEPSQEVRGGLKICGPNLKDFFLSWHRFCQARLKHIEPIARRNSKETLDWCLLWMSFKAFRMAVTGEPRMVSASIGASAPALKRSQSAPTLRERSGERSCSRRETRSDGSVQESPRTTLHLRNILVSLSSQTVTAAGPTPGDKAMLLAANPAGPLPPVGSPRRDRVEKAVFDANLTVDSPETADDSPGSAGWTSSMSILAQSGARGSPSALSPCWPELDFPCSARIMDKP